MAIYTFVGRMVTTPRWCIKADSLTEAVTKLYDGGHVLPADEEEAQEDVLLCCYEHGTILPHEDLKAAVASVDGAEILNLSDVDPNNLSGDETDGPSTS